jgi:uncharacterized membrane protein
MLPFSDIPYGSAPAYAFPLFEGLMYLLFILCLLHAFKRGMDHISYLLGGLIFGLLLEYINVVTNMGYVYGRFTIMFGTAPKDIPLCIGAGWGIIMYTARLFTDAFRLSLWASVAMDTLLAISIDLSMDTVAYRLHMWHWNWAGTGKDPLTADWFGVPYGNFFGWICVVFFYSGTNRLLEKWLTQQRANTRLWQFSIPLLSVIISQVCLYVTLVHIDGFLKDQFGVTSRHRFFFSLAALLVTLGYGLRHRKPLLYQPPYITWLVPVFCHIYFFAFLLIGGFYREDTRMIVVPITLACISIIVHTHPLLQKTKPIMHEMVQQ